MYHLLSFRHQERLNTTTGKLSKPGNQNDEKPNKMSNDSLEPRPDMESDQMKYRDVDMQDIVQEKRGTLQRQEHVDRLKSPGAQESKLAAEYGPREEQLSSKEPSDQEYSEWSEMMVDETNSNVEQY